ncbi:hypothetical protein OKW38_001958 [Paraburkholderia sp. MM5496-R1]|nr:hypothetical protein [Paraburkholderia sp. MM5384-R2]
MDALGEMTQAAGAREHISPRQGDAVVRSFIEGQPIPTIGLDGLPAFPPSLI